MDRTPLPDTTIGQMVAAFQQVKVAPRCLPTRIVYGTADAPIIAIHTGRTPRGIAGSRLEIYEGSPHALFVTDRDRFNHELLEFTRS